MAPMPLNSSSTPMAAFQSASTRVRREVSASEVRSWVAHSMARTITDGGIDGRPLPSASTGGRSRRQRRSHGRGRPAVRRTSPFVTRCRRITRVSRREPWGSTRPSTPTSGEVENYVAVILPNPVRRIASTRHDFLLAHLVRAEHGRVQQHRLAPPVELGGAAAVAGRGPTTLHDEPRCARDLAVEVPRIEQDAPTPPRRRAAVRRW